MKKKYILIFSDFTKNKNGRNEVTEYVLKKFSNKFNLLKINTGIPYGSSNYTLFFKKILLIFNAITQTSNLKKKINSTYFVLSGGKGLFFDLLIIVYLKILNKKIYIHHHSFSYLNNHSYLIYILSLIGKKNVIHIVLCNLMKKKLKKYKLIKKIIVLSNIILINKRKSFKNFNKKIKIGFISNIDFDKGISEYFEVINNLNNKNFEGLVAGPFLNKKVKSFVLKKVKKYKNIKYLGPIYDRKKNKFYRDLDVLLFPSYYKNEAEPLVIYEAQSYNILVISNSLGCTSAMIENEKDGFLISNKNEYTKKATQILLKLQSNSVKFNKVKKNLFNKYKLKIIKNNKVFNSLLELVN